jgi:hypothetical protein
MNFNEFKLVKQFISNVEKFEFTDYSIQRLVERVIVKQSVSDAILRGFIVEVHNNVSNDFRVLLRLHEGNRAVCVVVSLRDEIVVTAYLNHRKNMHPNLDWSKYTWNVPITSELIEGIIR